MQTDMTREDTAVPWHRGPVLYGIQLVQVLRSIKLAPISIAMVLILIFVILVHVSGVSDLRLSRADVVALPVAQLGPRGEV